MKNYPIDYISTIKVINSAPLYILLNLVNSESHNFTAEVIFRNSLNDWSHDFPNLQYSNWIKNKTLILKILSLQMPVVYQERIE